MNDDTRRLGPEEPQEGSTAAATPTSKPAGWKKLDNRTRIGAVIAAVALCGFGFLGGMAIGSASADDGGQADPGVANGYGMHQDRGDFRGDGGPQGHGQDGTAPDGTAPDGARPDGTAPDGTAPDGTRPDGEDGPGKGGCLDGDRDSGGSRGDRGAPRGTAPEGGPTAPGGDDATPGPADSGA
ncbi:hypothetical protein KV102_09245 [Mumia sp. zg.B53]|uniref:hypothetical protein n=1 Tax=Mumia sp. zg.B53 TaxID=2855449 RepID=UPI001C6EAFE7|nr:hypothetical protein [Mumia sp. zg.B53]MBW9215025.1 hypothetical protein [Mumia sp. zg.B53]